MARTIVRLIVLFAVLGSVGCGESARKSPSKDQVTDAVHAALPAFLAVEDVTLDVTTTGDASAKVNFKLTIEPKEDLYRIDRMVAGDPKVLLLKVVQTAGTRIPLYGHVQADRTVDKWNFGTVTFDTGLDQFGKPKGSFPDYAYVAESQAAKAALAQQQAKAAGHNLGTTTQASLGSASIGDTYTNSIDMKFAFIPAGKFLMGSPTFELGHKDNETQHPVEIDSAFLMGTTPVTCGQFIQFVRETSYKTQAEINGKGGWVFDGKIWKGDSKSTWQHPGFDQGESDPVVLVSYKDAVAFCDWLKAKENKKYRLPTEAEWEYACRAGTTTAYNTGVNDESSLTAVGWYRTNSDSRTHPVGLKNPNAWGLYDMHGNVMQWCSDWYAKDYPAGPATDPKGPASGKTRVRRGGGWYDAAQDCRSAWRNDSNPNDGITDGGFRVVLELD